MITIETMGRADIPFARSLTDIEQWGHLDEDFERFLVVNPQGCFIARDQGERIGIATSVIHGECAFLGNLIVGQGFRTLGAGALLLNQAIAWLKQQNIRTVELDGVFRAVPVYRSLGFKDKYPSLRLKRPAGPWKEAVADREAGRAGDITAILQFDREHLNIDRAAFLEQLLSLHRDTTYVIGRRSISAYGSCRPRATNVIHVGPLVAASADDASRLLSRICALHGAHDMTIGIPSTNASALRIALEHGFRVFPPSLRMYLGARVDYERSVYAIVSADVG